jgi:hypothetical protein
MGDGKVIWIRHSGISESSILPELQNGQLQNQAESKMNTEARVATSRN